MKSQRIRVTSLILLTVFMLFLMAHFQSEFSVKTMIRRPLKLVNTVRRFQSDMQWKSGGSVFTDIYGKEIQVQVFSVDNPKFVNVIYGKMSVFSAIMDHRGPQPVVKLMITSNLPESYPCQCRLWKVNEQFVGHQISWANATYRVIPASRARTTGYILSCAIDNDEVKKTATHVDIVCDSFPAENNVLQIVNTPIHLKYNYTVCLKPIYGDVIPRYFSWFLEVNRMFGADHFLIYNVSKTPKNLKPVFDAYSKAGLMTVYDWELGFNQSLIFSGQILSVNDCLYRAMLHSKYIVATDLDEFIVPLKHNSWDKLLADVDPKQNFSSYSFRNLFFGRKPTPQNQISNRHCLEQHLTGMANFTPRFPILNYPLHSKYIADPRRTTLTSIHRTYISIPPVPIQVINEDVGLLFHYRRGIVTGVEEDKVGFNPKRMFDFRDTIMERISKAPYKYSD